MNNLDLDKELEQLADYLSCSEGELKNEVRKILIRELKRLDMFVSTRYIEGTELKDINYFRIQDRIKELENGVTA